MVLIDFGSGQEVNDWAIIDVQLDPTSAQTELTTDWKTTINDTLYPIQAAHDITAEPMPNDNSTSGKFQSRSHSEF